MPKDTPAGLDPRLVEALQKAAGEGKITCTAARRLAEELGVPVRAGGEACDALGIKITACELGCF